MATAGARGAGAPSGVLARIGWVPFAAVLGAVVLLGVAGLTWVTSPYWGRNPVAAPQQVGSVPTAPGRVATVISPNRIEIPKIKAVAPIVPVATTSDGELEIPRNPRVVGWWHPGAKPGAKKGTAILAGHINFNGVSGTLADIGKLDPGDRVYVFGRHNANKKTEVRFRVTGVRTYHKTALPYKQIFDQQSVGRIAIVTCGGPFDAATGNYLDNIVVFAVPA